MQPLKQANRVGYTLLPSHSHKLFLSLSPLCVLYNSKLYILWYPLLFICLLLISARQSFLILFRLLKFHLILIQFSFLNYIY